MSLIKLNNKIILISIHNLEIFDYLINFYKSTFNHMESFFLPFNTTRSSKFIRLNSPKTSLAAKEIGYDISQLNVISLQMF